MALAVQASFHIQGGTVSSQDLVVSGFSAGDLCIVMGFAFNASDTTLFDPTTDNGGNTYTEDSVSAHTSTFRSWCNISSTVVVTPPTLVTVPVTGASPVSVVCLQVTGADTSSPLDTADANGTTSALDDPTTDNINTTNADTILVAGLCHDGADVTFAPPASWTMARENESNSNTAYAAAYRIVSASGTYAAQWVTGGARDYGMTLAAYKQAAGAPLTGLMWIRA